MYSGENTNHTAAADAACDGPKSKVIKYFDNVLYVEAAGAEEGQCAALAGQRCLRFGDGV